MCGVINLRVVETAVVKMLDVKFQRVNGCVEGVAAWKENVPVVVTDAGGVMQYLRYQQRVFQW
jgi:hypothetical protein